MMTMEALGELWMALFMTTHDILEDRCPLYKGWLDLCLGAPEQMECWRTTTGECGVHFTTDCFV